MIRLACAVCVLQALASTQDNADFLQLSSAEEDPQHQIHHRKKKPISMVSGQGNPLCKEQAFCITVDVTDCVLPDQSTRDADMIARCPCTCGNMDMEPAITNLHDEANLYLVHGDTLEQPSDSDPAERYDAVSDELPPQASGLTRRQKSGITMQVVQAWVCGTMSRERMSVLEATTSFMKQEMPDWEHRLIVSDDFNRETFPRTFDQMLLARDVYVKRHGYDGSTFESNHPLFGLPLKGCSSIVDLAKFEYLDTYGGVWLDINMQLIRDPSPLLEEASKYRSPNGDVMIAAHEWPIYEPGGENELPNFDWSYPALMVGKVSTDAKSPMVPLSCGFFAVTPNHISLEKVMSLVGNFKPEQYEKNANEATGPFLFGSVVDPDKGGTWVLPSEVFYPAKWPKKACDVDQCKKMYPNAYGVEHWEFGGSWLADETKQQAIDIRDGKEVPGYQPEKIMGETPEAKTIDVSNLNQEISDQDDATAKDAEEIETDQATGTQEDNQDEKQEEDEQEQEAVDDVESDDEVTASAKADEEETSDSLTPVLDNYDNMKASKLKEVLEGMVTPELQTGADESEESEAETSSANSDALPSIENEADEECTEAEWCSTEGDQCTAEEGVRTACPCTCARFAIEASSEREREERRETHEKKKKSKHSGRQRHHHSRHQKAGEATSVEECAEGDACKSMESYQCGAENEMSEQCPCTCSFLAQQRD